MEDVVNIVYWHIVVKGTLLLISALVFAAMSYLYFLATTREFTEPGKQVPKEPSPEDGPLLATSFLSALVAFGLALLGLNLLLSPTYYALKTLGKL